MSPERADLVTWRSERPPLGRATRLSWTLPLVAATLVAACGDSQLTRTNNDTPDMRERPAYNPTDDRPDGGGGDGANADRCCVLVPASGETTLGVGLNGTLDLGVYLFSLSTGEPVADELIAWSATGDSTAGGRLSAANAFTDLAGFAQIRFQGGLSPAAYEVTASHPGANSVTYRVDVLDLPVGALEVTVRHPSASLYAVGPIVVRLFRRADLTCDFLPPGG
jgi:hypothetical protein